MHLVNSKHEPNRGLSADFNRYLAHLDALLPRRCRSDDGGAAFLHSALCDLPDPPTPARQHLEQFLAECDDFRRRQFWVDSGRENHHTGSCWLPLLILGKEWRDCASHLLGIELGTDLSELSAAERILYKPVLDRGPFKLQVALKDSIRNVSEDTYERFVNRVKSRFTELETTYDASEKVLTIRKGRMLTQVFETAGDIDYPPNGRLPQWLSALLDFSGVASVTLEYPLVKRDVPSLSEAVRAALIIPSCPLPWRSRDTFQAAAELGTIAESLEVGRAGAFHVILTAGDEWYPLLDGFVHRVIGAGEAPAACDSQPDEEQRKFRRQQLSRAMTLHPKLELRIDSDFQWLRTAFQQSGNSDAVQTPDSSLSAEPAAIPVSLLTRLDDCEYVTGWARHFEQRARAALQSIKADALTTAIPSTKASRALPQEYVIKVNATARGFACHVLESLAKSLKTLADVEEQLLQTKAWRTQIQNLWEGGGRPLRDADPTIANPDAFAYVMQQAVQASDPLRRAKALATVIYVLVDEDAVSDSESHGHIDDFFAISAFILEPPSNDGPSEPVCKWAKDLHARIDGLISRGEQRRVSLRLDEMTKKVAGEMLGAPDTSKKRGRPKT